MQVQARLATHAALLRLARRALYWSRKLVRQEHMRRAVHAAHAEVSTCVVFLKYGGTLVNMTLASAVYWAILNLLRKLVRQEHMRGAVHAAHAEVSACTVFLRYGGAMILVKLCVTVLKNYILQYFQHLCRHVLLVHIEAVAQACEAEAHSVAPCVLHALR